MCAHEGEEGDDREGDAEASDARPSLENSDHWLLASLHSWRDLRHREEFVFAQKSTALQPDVPTRQIQSIKVPDIVQNEFIHSFLVASPNQPSPCLSSWSSLQLLSLLITHIKFTSFS
jgi:hypothetical protein